MAMPDGRVSDETAGCERDPSGQRPPDPPFVVCSFARFRRAIADPIYMRHEPRAVACGSRVCWNDESPVRTA